MTEDPASLRYAEGRRGKFEALKTGREWIK
jgi:hypothetical protein